MHFLSLVVCLSATLVLVRSDETKGNFGGKVLMCYIAQWSVYRIGPGKFSMSDIDPDLCTHLIYAYAGLNGTSYEIMSRDPAGEIRTDGPGLIEEVVDMKKRNPSLKVLASIGGWMEGSVNYSRMVSTTERRAVFINSVMEYLKTHNLDGFDIAWNFPGDRGGVRSDKGNLVLLLKEMRQKFDECGYLLTIQLDGRRHQIDVGYDLPQISKYVDYMNLATYQYMHPWDMKTGPNAPLPLVEESVNYLIQKGAVPSKMLLGFPTYGHPFILKSVVTDGKFMSVQTTDQIIPGFWSTEDGFIGFNEVCEDLTNTYGWTEYWDDASSTPFAVKETRFYSYDDVKSFKEKLDLLNWKKLGGAMVWSMDTDDFTGRCSEKNYQLIRSIKKYFMEDKSKPKYTISIKPNSNSSNPYKPVVIATQL